MIRRAIAVAALASAGASGVTFDDEELDTGEVAQAATNGSCPAWMCGMNSPVIDNFGFHELNLDHAPEPESGFKYVSFTLGGLEYEMHVDGDVITGTRPNAPTIAGTGLIGAEIAIANADHTYAIRIVDVGTTKYWARLPNGIQPDAQTYTLQWVLAGDLKWQDLCTNPPLTEDDALNMDAHASLVFAGERVDAKTKKVADPDKRWFDIGCAGSTLAKMHLTGRTEASQGAGFTSTIAARQTMLKMLSADYCGGGTPFTVAGMPLRWADDLGSMKVAGSAKLEARWDANGATCLVKPRVAVNPNDLAKATFPAGSVTAAIYAECPLLKTCADTTLVPTGPLLSANPTIITPLPIHIPLYHLP